MRNAGWTLVMDNALQTPVEEGDVLQDSRGAFWTVSSGVGAAPHKPSSTGRIWVQGIDGHSREYFPSVFNCKWIEDEIDESRDQTASSGR